MLADYLNTRFREREDSLKIMFIREREGVYKFGSKRVYIKVEQGNQIMVRVGGGFMSIDKFVNQYTEAELDRIQRRDMFSRSMTKIASQSFAACFAECAKETSLINTNRKISKKSKTRTPKRNLTPTQSL